MQSWVHLINVDVDVSPQTGGLIFAEGGIDDLADGWRKDGSHRIPVHDNMTMPMGDPTLAVGWVVDVRSRGVGGLWALVDWTDHGLECIRDNPWCLPILQSHGRGGPWRIIALGLSYEPADPTLQRVLPRDSLSLTMRA
jgi:hypothetical protein